MDAQSVTSRSSHDSGRSSSGLGWPLSITLCGAIILSWALGNCLVWWTRRNTNQPARTWGPPSSYNELESGSGHQTPLLPWLLSTTKNKVVLKKDHQPPEEAVSIHAWPSSTHLTETRSIMPTPVLPVLPQNSTFNLGKTASSEDWSVMAKMRRNKLRRALSLRSDEDWGSRQGLPQDSRDGLGNSHSSRFQSRMFFARDSFSQRWSSTLLLPQNGGQTTRYDEEIGMASVARTPNFALGDIPECDRSGERQGSRGPSKGLGLTLKSIFSSRNLGSSATGLQTLDSRSPTSDSLLSLRGLRLADLIYRSPRVSEAIPAAPSSLNLTDRYLYPSSGSRRSVDSVISTDTIILREPRPIFYRDTSSPALIAHCHGSPQHQRQATGASDMSNAPSVGSNIAGGYPSSSIQALLEEKIQTLLEPPNLPMSTTGVRGPEPEAQQARSPQLERPRGPRPLPKVRTQRS